jgi:hypothetical protein
MLTAESEDGLMRSLVTRQYLASAAGEQVKTGLWVEAAAVAAAEARAKADYEWSLAAENWRSAANGLATAAKQLAGAKAAAATAKQTYQRLMDVTETDHSSDYGRIKTCGDWLIRLLSKSGFSGENLREAWAIVMRESGGRADAVSSSNDLGLFQINTATWQSQPWFDREELLKKKFNAKVGFLLSDGGKSWYSWGLDGHGRPDAGAYINAGWSEERIVAKIIEPYILWYARYPCRPAYEKNTWAALPIDIVEASKPRYEDNGAEPLAAGGGQLPSAETSSGSPSGPASGAGVSPLIPSIAPSSLPTAPALPSPEPTPAPTLPESSVAAAPA